MSRLVAADLLKLRRRRGLWGTVLLLVPGLVLLLALLGATGIADVDGGRTFVDDGAAIATLLGSLVAVVLGARLGSEEHAAGTVRYQLLTGQPRLRLYGSKVAVLAIGALVIATTSLAALTVGGLLAPRNGLPAIEAADVLDGWWAVLLTCFVYGALSLGIGALARSTGPAIAFALLLSLLGTNLVSLLTLLGDGFRYVVLGLAVDRLTLREADPGDEVTLLGAVACAVVWVLALLALGFARLRRLEA